MDRFPIFRDHPYLFPLLIVSIVFAIITILVIFLCKETLPKAERLNSHAKDLARLESESQDLEASLLDQAIIQETNRILSADGTKHVPSGDCL